MMCAQEMDRSRFPATLLKFTFSERRAFKQTNSIIMMPAFNSQCSKQTVPSG
jgi:hypothetical protein